MDRAARVILEILLQKAPTTTIYNLENPIRQPIEDLRTIITEELRISNRVVSFNQWCTLIKQVEQATELAEFFRDDFEALACGSIVLDTSEARKVSKTLRGSSGVEKNLIRSYIHRWQRSGFLD